MTRPKGKNTISKKDIKAAVKVLERMRTLRVRRKRTATRTK
jgi:hypothetical protein